MSSSSLVHLRNHEGSYSSLSNIYRAMLGSYLPISEYIQLRSVEWKDTRVIL